MEIFIVGGAVRDEILGFPFHERDWVVVGASPKVMLDAGYQQVGVDFPVFLHPETNEEYALARTERKSGKGYTGFTVYAGSEVTLEEDLSRRDLTINAIAQDAKGNLIDPFGGKKDAENRILRHVSEAFTEDPLRVLRIARFAARYQHLGFKIAPETQALMATMAESGELDSLVPERVWKETSRALMELAPAEFFRVLRSCGALVCIFPEINALFGVPQPEQHHPEIDTGEHALLSLTQAAKLSEELEVRFAALIHDLGKASTPEEYWPKHHGHEQLSAPLVQAFCERLRVPNACLDLAKIVAEYHTHCHRALELTPKTIHKLFSVLGAYKSNQKLQLFLLACEADARGRTGFENKDYPQSDYLRNALAHCDGITAAPFIAQGLKGAAIGDALNHARVQKITEFKRQYNL